VADRAVSPRWRHDIKNQLGIVVGFAELLLADIGDGHPLRQDVEDILSAAHAAMALVHELDEPGPPAREPAPE
jgi:hypothetical protein